MGFLVLAATSAWGPTATRSFKHRIMSCFFKRRSTELESFHLTDGRTCHRACASGTAILLGRVSDRRLEYEVTIDDPETWIKP